VKKKKNANAQVQDALAWLCALHRGHPFGKADSISTIIQEMVSFRRSEAWRICARSTTMKKVPWMLKKKREGATSSDRHGARKNRTEVSGSLSNTTCGRSFCGLPPREAVERRQIDN